MLDCFYTNECKRILERKQTMNEQAQMKADEKAAKAKAGVLNLGAVGVADGTNILKIKVPPELEVRVPTGMGWYDEMLGGGEEETGLTPSNVQLFTGSPGAGKTTLALQIADSWTGTGNLCLLNGNEESVLQVRKTTKRLKQKNGFIIGEDRLMKRVFEHADKIRAMRENKDKKFLMILDSLQTHDDGFYSNGGTNSMTPARVIQAVTEYCKRTWAMAIVIGQVNKDGKFAGKQAIKHYVDQHVHLFIDQKPSSESYLKRIIKVEKNRFGFAQVGYFLNYDANVGIVGQTPWSPEVEAGGE
jgi:DNA repair protein RadA/Sms